MKQKHGFAAMSPEKRREIASIGGKAAHEYGVAYEWNQEEAKEAGKIGGETVSQDSAHMAEIGRKGGKSVSKDKKHMAKIGRLGGKAKGKKFK